MKPFRYKPKGGRLGDRGGITDVHAGLLVGSEFLQSSLHHGAVITAGKESPEDRVCSVHGSCLGHRAWKVFRCFCLLNLVRLNGSNVSQEGCLKCSLKSKGAGHEEGQPGVLGVQAKCREGGWRMSWRTQEKLWKCTERVWGQGLSCCSAVWGYLPSEGGCRWG